VAHGITNVSLKYNKPVIFGVLTPKTQQAKHWNRAGRKQWQQGR